MIDRNRFLTGAMCAPNTVVGSLIGLHPKYTGQLH